MKGIRGSEEQTQLCIYNQEPKLSQDCSGVNRSSLKPTRGVGCKRESKRTYPVVYQ